MLVDIVEAPVFSHAAVMQRIRARLRGRTPRRLRRRAHRPAAVAVMLLDIGGVTHVPLTRRAPHLRIHPGQISFPGGARDAEDPSFAATALRETQEELGLEPGSIDVLGLLDDEPTSSGFIITPVLAELRLRPGYAPNTAEVAQVIEAPLTVLGDPTRSEGLVAGQLCRTTVYRYREHQITGATARILAQLEGLLLP